MKRKLLLAIFVGLMPAGAAMAQMDSTLDHSGSQTSAVTFTHWSNSVKLFWSHEKANWDKNSFDDAVLDTSRLVISRAQAYELLSLSTSFSTYGLENEWNVALGKLTEGDDLVLLDLGFGLLRGAIPKTQVAGQITSLSYISSGSGHPLRAGSANYSYSIQGTYVGVTVPLMVEWRYGLNPVSLNARVGMLYRIDSVSVDRKLSASGFPQDYDAALNDGRFDFFDGNTLTENYHQKVSELVIAAIPAFGVSARLPLTSQAGKSGGPGMIIGADFGLSTRVYLAFSY